VTDNEVLQVWTAARSRLSLCCSERHAHSAASGCFMGDPKDVDICKLGDSLLGERRKVREAVLGNGQDAVEHLRAASDDRREKT